MEFCSGSGMFTASSLVCFQGGVLSNSYCCFEFVGCSFSWISRSVNLTVDCLANLSYTRMGHLEWVANPPPSLVDILSSDATYFALFSLVLCLVLPYF